VANLQPALDFPRRQITHDAKVLGDLIQQHLHVIMATPEPESKDALDLALDGLRAFDLDELRRYGVRVGADAYVGLP
jgi:hypothetical protein